MARMLRSVITFASAMALVIVQTAAVAQDAQHAAGAAGQAFGTESLPDPAALFGAPVNGTVTLFPDSASPLEVPLDELFPGSSGPAVPDLQALFGDEAGASDASAARADELMEEGSAEGEAYRLVLDSRTKIGPDLRDDPLFDTTREVLEALSAAADEFSDCEEESVFVPGTVTAHVPDYRHCERLIMPGNQSCDLFHDVQFASSDTTFQITLHPYVVPGPYPMYPSEYDALGKAVTVEFNFATGIASWTETEWHLIASGTDHERMQQVDVARTANFAEPVDVAAYCVGAGVDAGFIFDIERDTYNVVFPGQTGWVVQGPVLSEPTIQQAPTCGNGLKATVLFSAGDCQRSRQGSGENKSFSDECVAPTFNGRFVVDQIESDTWGPQTCLQAIQASKNASCSIDFEVVDGPGNMGNFFPNCASIDGVAVCPGDSNFQRLSPAPFDPEEELISRLVLQARFTSDSCALPAVVCYEDDDGNQVCPEGEEATTPVLDSCEDLRSNPACSYVSTTTVEDAVDEDGNPYVWEDTYDCGFAVSEDTVERQVGLICPGSIPGLGSDFVTPPVETNENFAQVAATLQAANMMAMDSDCKTDEVTGETSCDLFGGEPYHCKKAVGGVVNCCESPTGVSLAQYLQLAFAVRELDGAIGHLDPNSSLRGAWEVMTGPIDTAWTELTEPLSSAFNSITGSTTAQTTDAAAQGLLGTVEQAMLKQVAEWTTQLFGESATNLLFSAAAEAGGGAAVEGGVMADVIQLGGGEALLGTALSWVMAAYTIYSVTMLIIQIAWKCKQSEFELSAKIELKSCHYNGTYCASKVLGFCIERKQSYCCFSSPLSRIMQEQLRPLLGRGWGSAKNPDCGPIDVEDFQAADWSKVDLSEWMAILISTDMMPDVDSITIEELTGSGRALAAGIEPEVRLGTPERTQERMKDVPVDDIMDQAKDELLGITAP